jgi:multiple sugar transport system ATP-binding protein
MADLQLRGVAKAYERVEVLRDVNLEVGDGEFVVLVGPSGCGKSTLLRMIAGLEEITDGELTIGGRRMNEVPPRNRDIAMVFQSYALYPHMTVARNMGFPMEIARRPRSERGRTCEPRSWRTGLGALLDRFPRALSGGQRQRVAMGRAHRARAHGVPLRRAALEPRRQPCAWRCGSRSRACTSGSAPPPST